MKRRLVDELIRRGASVVLERVTYLTTVEQVKRLSIVKNRRAYTEELRP